MSDEANELLAALTASELALLRPHLTRINLEQHSVLQAAAQPIEHIFFPVRGMVSLIATGAAGEEVEIAGIGREGAIGTKIGILPQLAFATAVVQLPGAALRIPLDKFQEVALGNAAITHVATCANDIMLANLQQAAACNAFHTTEARFARWLLHARDRYEEDALPLTQEYLGQMLGVRRTTVSVAAGILQERGLVEYTRGKIKIKNRPELEKLSCGCYDSVRKNVAVIVETAQRAKTI